MKFRRIALLYSPMAGLLLAALLLTACGFSLAADVTPPPEYHPTTVPSQAPASAVSYPLVSPNPADGAAIYAEKCAPCHGDQGHGDGPRAAQLPNPPSPIGNAELARQASPASWFNVVTQGRIDQLMPPFTSLSDRERWDVVAYVFSLSASPQAISQGAALYATNCARCHGPQGKGDGPEAAGLSKPPTDLTQPQFIASQRSADLYQAISQGVSPDMPAFADKLSEAERWDLSDYLRSLTFSTGQQLVNASTPGPAATAPSSEATTLASTPVITAGLGVSGTAGLTQTLGVITGTVVNASGGEVPGDLNVTLHGFDQMTPVMTATASLDSNHAFTFEDVPMEDGRVYVAAVNYNGTLYNSEIGTASQGLKSLSLPINIFETTTDTSGLSVDRLHLFFELTDDKTIRVIELFIVSNASTKTVVPKAKGEPAVTFKLPEGATGLEFQDGELGGRYLKTADGFGDTEPVRPGPGGYQVVFAFNLPMGSKLEMAQPMNMPVQAVVVLVPTASVTVQGASLEDAGTRDVQGTSYHMYNRAALNAGEALELTISKGGGLRGLATTNTNLLVGVGALGLVLVLAGVWLFMRNRPASVSAQPAASLPSEPVAESADALMDAILALDDLYRDGKLPEDAYRQRRAELKARLRAAMAQEDGDQG